MTNIHEIKKSLEANYHNEEIIQIQLLVPLQTGKTIVHFLRSEDDPESPNYLPRYLIAIFSMRGIEQIVDAGYAS